MGRSFYRCPYWQDRRVDCGFFRWVDELPKVEGGVIVAELSRRRNDEFSTK
ncbi:hypothetical protein LINPERPRIM_LOCUS33389 [Linum perenne]